MISLAEAKRSLIKHTPVYPQNPLFLIANTLSIPFPFIFVNKIKLAVREKFVCHLFAIPNNPQGGVISQVSKVNFLAPFAPSNFLRAVLLFVS